MPTPNARESDSSVLRPQRSTPVRAAWNALLAFLAWVLFIYWWSVVARGTTQASVQDAVVVLILFVVATLVVTFAWVRHNLRIAKRGKRGLTNRYMPPVFTRDFLNRPIDLGPEPARRESRWLVLDADHRSKRYEPRELMPFFSENAFAADYAFDRAPLGLDIP